MTIAQDIRRTLAHYGAHFPPESGFVGGFASQIDRMADPASRRTLPWHATASAVVLDPQTSTTLMIHHRASGLWLCPGGHIDPADSSLMAAALREVEEETGVRPEHLAIPDWWSAPVPIDIDYHAIAARPEKQELPHHHLDFRFIFALKRDVHLTAQAEEILGLDWKPFASLPLRIANRVGHALGSIVENSP